MIGKSSSKQISTKNGGVELENLENLKENQKTHLSGSYARTLVKELTSSKTKENKSSDVEVSSFSNQNSAKNGEGFGEKPKKQVRRRLHTRPYQERLLNMAEARREIVTALKYHRAAMKKAQEMENQSLMESSPQEICLENEAKLNSRRNRIDSSNSTSNFPYCSLGPDYSWPVSPVPPPPTIFQENLNISLPNQTSGLNLNFQDFNNLDATPYYNPTTAPSLFSSSSASASASSSSSPPLSAAAATTAETPCMAPMVAESGVPEMELDLHPAVDDKRMAEIRSIGEKHQMEWNDNMNLVTSARWFKFLKAMEISPEDKTEDYGLFSPFDEVMEFPDWFNVNESCLNDSCSDDYLQVSDLPCMEIEEIEGMDGEWLA